MMNYSVVLEHNEEGSWTVTCPVLPGCISEGETKQEALAHIRDAVSLYLRAVQKELILLKKRHHAQIARIAV